MKQTLHLIFFFFVASFISGCSAQSGSSNLSQDIVGCWEIEGVSNIVESNFPEFDKHAKEDQKKAIEEEVSYIFKYENDKINVFDKNGKLVSEIPTSYKIEGDSLYTMMAGAGGYRVGRGKLKIQIVNDTLYTEADATPEIERIQSYTESYEMLTFPEDFEIKKAVRKIKLVRLKDCSQYQE